MWYFVPLVGWWVHSVECAVLQVSWCQPSLVLLITALSICSCRAAITDDEVNRIKHGVFFTHLLSARPTTGIWSLTYHVAILSDTTWPRQKPRYCVQMIPNQNSSAQVRQLCIAFADQIDALAQAVANSGKFLNKIELTLFDLLPLYSQQQSQSGRDTRSWLPIFSSAWKTVMGTATDEDLKVVDEHVKPWQTPQKGNLTRWKCFLNTWVLTWQLTTAGWITLSQRL